MDWKPIIAALHEGLPDARVHEAVRQFMAEELDYDGERVRFSPDAVVLIEQKALVIDPNHQDGAFLSARVVLDPVFANGQYSRANVIPR